MLAVAVIWAYLLASAGFAGWAGCRLLAVLLNIKEDTRISFPLQWLLGLAILTCLFSFLSLVMPMNALAQLIVLALTLLAFFIWLQARKFSLRQFASPVLQEPLPVLALLLLAALTLLLLSTSVPSNFDTGLYHAQAIRWIETYPAVPGLANFHSRLGFNSSWLLTQALFSFAFLGIQSFHLNTSVLFLAASIYFGMGVRNLWRGSRRYSDWLRTLFFPLVFYILSSEVSSPGNDAPVTLITWISMAEWLAFFEDGRPARDIRPAVLTLLSFYTVTIKLSALPLAGFGLGALILLDLSHRQWRSSLVTGGLAVLFLLPWMARSAVLSGYLVYPFPAIDIFQFDWKVPRPRVQLESEIIRAWAVLPRQSLERVASLSFRARTVEWFMNQTANQRWILLLDLAAPFLYLGLAVWGKLRASPVNLFKMAWPVWLATYAGLIYWFFSAPDYRFGAGYVIAGLALSVAPLLLFIQAKGPKISRYLPWLVAGVLIAYQGYMLASSLDLKSLPQRLLLPADYPSSPTQPCQADRQTIFIPEEIAYGQCWYGVFPCLPYCNQEFELRGAGWQDGFRYKAAAPPP